MGAVVLCFWVVISPFPGTLFGVPNFSSTLFFNTDWADEVDFGGSKKSINRDAVMNGICEPYADPLHPLHPCLNTPIRPNPFYPSNPCSQIARVRATETSESQRSACPGSPSDRNGIDALAPEHNVCTDTPRQNSYTFENRTERARHF